MNGPHVYLLAEREFIRMREPVIKIGCATDLTVRLNRAPRGSVCIAAVPVNHLADAKRSVLEAMSRRGFTARPDIGPDYVAPVRAASAFASACASALVAFSSAVAPHIRILPTTPDSVSLHTTCCTPCNSTATRSCAFPCTATSSASGDETSGFDTADEGESDESEASTDDTSVTTEEEEEESDESDESEDDEDEDEDEDDEDDKSDDDDDDDEDDDESDESDESEDEADSGAVHVPRTRAADKAILAVNAFMRARGSDLAGSRMSAVDLLDAIDNFAGAECSASVVLACLREQHGVHIGVKGGTKLYVSFRAQRKRAN